MAISKKLEAKLKKRKAELETKGNRSFDYLVFKEGTTRIRPLPVGEDEEPGFPMIHFYMGADIKGVISPATFGEPCAIMEMFEKLSKGDDSEKAMADDFKPKEKYLMPCLKYEDDKGKKIDDNLGQTLALLSGPQYQSLIDLYLDDEYGDFTDAEDGYDIKIKRTGKGRMDTKYTFHHTNSRPIPKGAKDYGAQTYDTEELVRAITPNYERTEQLISQFLNLDDTPSSDSKPKKKKGKKKKKLSDDD